MSRNQLTRPPVEFTTILWTVGAGAVVAVLAFLNGWVLYTAAREVVPFTLREYTFKIAGHSVLLAALAIAVVIVGCELTAGVLLERAYTAIQGKGKSRGRIGPFLFALFFFVLAVGAELVAIDLRADAMKRQVNTLVLQGILLKEVAQIKMEEIQAMRVTLTAISFFTIALVTLFTAILTRGLRKIFPSLDVLMRWIGLVITWALAGLFAVFLTLVFLLVAGAGQLVFWAFDLLDETAELLVRRPFRWCAEQWGVIWRPEVNPDTASLASPIVSTITPASKAQRPDGTNGSKHNEATP